MLSELGKGHFHNKTYNPLENGHKFSKGETTIQTSTPAAPSVTSSMADYVANYPKLFALQQQYAPQEAAMNVGLAQQYAEPLGQAYKTAQEAMYPQETAITQALNQQVQEGMGSQVPDWMRQEYLSNLRANLGSNAGSGIGADYTSRGLLQQKQEWQQYYNNLGLSITGRQPIATAQTPQTTNQLANYTPQGVMNYNASNYSTAANIYGSQLGYNAQTSGQSSPWMNVLGRVGGGIAGGLTGGWATNFFK